MLKSRPINQCGSFSAYKSKRVVIFYTALTDFLFGYFIFPVNLEIKLLFL